MKRLTKSSTDKKISGVLGGIANYLNVDATFVRLAFLVLAYVIKIFPAIPVYIILHFVMPYDYEERRNQKPHFHNTTHKTRKDVTPNEDDWSDF